MAHPCGAATLVEHLEPPGWKEQDGLTRVTRELQPWKSQGTLQELPALFVSEVLRTKLIPAQP